MSPLHCSGFFIFGILLYCTTAHCHLNDTANTSVAGKVAPNHLKNDGVKWLAACVSANEKSATKDRIESVGVARSGPSSSEFSDQEWLGNIFIGIAGMIGAGKSTLATALGEHLGIQAYYEPVQDNEYLQDFYQDTKAHSFAMQVYLLNKRFQQHQEIIWKGQSAVQDRTIYEDSIFARMLAETGLMDKRDYRTYQSLFKNMSNFMCKPSVIVYLDVSPKTSQERIRMRSRGVEADIELGYLESLHEGYERFVKEISRVIPVIRIDYERFATADEMAEVIKREYLDANFLRQAARFDPTR